MKSNSLSSLQEQLEWLHSQPSCAERDSLINQVQDSMELHHGRGSACTFTAEKEVAVAFHQFLEIKDKLALIRDIHLIINNHNK
jgi:hypothetical protein